MYFLFDNDNTPFEFASNHIHMIGWPVVCFFAYWIGRKIQDGIHTYKQDRKLLVDTKATVDIKTDRALAVITATKATVDIMMNNHLHTIEAKVDLNNEKTDKLVDLLGSIKENTAVMAAVMKDRNT